MQLVQYGRLSPGDDLCPPNIRYPGLMAQTSRPGPPETQAEEARFIIINFIFLIISIWCLKEKCLILEAIRTVEERCHGKESCSVQARRIRRREKPTL